MQVMGGGIAQKSCMYKCSVQLGLQCITASVKSLHNNDSTTSLGPSMGAHSCQSVSSARVLVATAVHACEQPRQTHVQPKHVSRRYLTEVRGPTVNRRSSIAGPASRPGWSDRQLFVVHPFSCHPLHHPARQVLQSPQLCPGGGAVLYRLDIVGHLQHQDPVLASILPTVSCLHAINSRGRNSEKRDDGIGQPTGQPKRKQRCQPQNRQKTIRAEAVEMCKQK